MKTTQAPTPLIEALKSRYIYDPIQGIVYSRRSRRPVVARTTTITSFQYPTLKIAYALHHGHWPAQTVTAKDGNPQNMKPKNLQTLHIYEKRQAQACASNLKGISLTASGKFIARVFHNKKQHHAGIYDTAEQATQARIALLIKLTEQDPKPRQQQLQSMQLQIAKPRKLKPVPETQAQQPLQQPLQQTLTAQELKDIATITYKNRDLLRQPVRTPEPEPQPATAEVQTIRVPAGWKKIL